MEDGAAVFKASKRRKVALKTDRSRSGNASEEETTSVVKAKAPMRTTTRGIQFTRSAPKVRNDSPDEQTGLPEAVRDAGATPPAGLLSRFVGSGSSNHANVNNDILMYVAFRTVFLLQEGEFTGYPATTSVARIKAHVLT